MPRVGERLVLEIENLSTEGEAVAHLGKYVLFIPESIPGEQVLAEVVSVGARYGRARVVEVIHHSPCRVKPRCVHFGTCGGCTWQHIDYPDQLRWKERLLRSTLEHRLKGVHLHILPIEGMREPWGTRNKVHFLLGLSESRLALGHYRSRTREFVPITECPVHHPAGNRVARSTLQLLEHHQVEPFSEAQHRGTVRQLVLRVGNNPIGVHATLVSSVARFPGDTTLGEELMAADAQVTGIHVNVNPRPGSIVFGSRTHKLAGEDHMHETIGDVQYKISPTSFFQTNLVGAAKLVEIVLRYVPTLVQERILDLYAGVGLFAIPLARRGHRVVAVEENSHAVSDAIESLKQNRISSCRYHSGKVESALRKLARGESFQTVILDPPRAGCPEWILRTIGTKLRPKRIIDVSCDPSSLARDIALLSRLGYRVREIQPIDMFPHTAHIESVALMELTR